MRNYSCWQQINLAAGSLTPEFGAILYPPFSPPGHSIFAWYAQTKIGVTHDNVL